MNHSSPGTPPSTLRLVVAFAAVYIIWGSTYLCIRFAIDTIPPLLMAGTRFLIAGSLMYGWMRFYKHTPAPTRIQWRTMIIVGGLLLVGGNGGVTWAEQKVPSGLAALMVSAVPLWIAVVGWIAFDHVRPTSRMALGLLAGLAGVALLVGPANLSGDDSLSPVGTLALLGATLSWSIGTLYSRRAPQPDNPQLSTGMEMLAGGIILTLVATLRGEWADLNLGAVSLKSALALGYLTIFGSIVAFTAYVWLLRHTTAARATTYAYVNPVVALILGWALADEALSPRTLIAAAIIIGSVVIITTSSTAQPAASAPAPEKRPVPEPFPAEIGADR